MSRSITNLLIIELSQAANRTECKQLGSKVSPEQILAVGAVPVLDKSILHSLESSSNFTCLEINSLFRPEIYWHLF